MEGFIPLVFVNADYQTLIWTSRCKQSLMKGKLRYLVSLCSVIAEPWSSSIALLSFFLLSLFLSFFLSSILLCMFLCVWLVAMGASMCLCVCEQRILFCFCLAEVSYPCRWNDESLISQERALPNFSGIWEGAGMHYPRSCLAWGIAVS